MAVVTIPQNTSLFSSPERSTELTVTFSEEAKGWICFKSFIQDNGLSLNNDYYTLKYGILWKHHDEDVDRNTFYENHTPSYVDVLFNEESATVKTFGSMKYEGSQAKITQNLGDEEYYNNEAEDGWYVEYGTTDLQLAGKMEFKDKEGKWFSYMKGVPVKSVKDLNSKEFSFQGIDILDSIVPDGEQVYGCTDPLANNYNREATIDDGSCIYNQTTCENIFSLTPGTWGNGSIIASQYTIIPGWTVVNQIYTCTVTIEINFTPPDVPYTFILQDAQGLDITTNNNVLTTGDSAIWTVPCNELLSLKVVTSSGCIYEQTYGPINTGGGTQTNVRWRCSPGNICVPCNQTCQDNNPLWITYATQSGCQANCVTVPTIVYGCTDATASNYNPLATIDDGSCIITPTPIYGCTDPLASNYDPLATVDDGSCVYPALIYGCTDPTANNYYAGATMDDGSCTYDIYGCTDATASNYNPLATIDDGSCILPCAWQHGGLSGGGPVTWQTNYTSYTNSNGGGGQVLVSSQQPGGPYTIELFISYIGGSLHPNTFGTNSHVTNLGFAGTVTYENMLPGQYIIRATDINGCVVWMGLVMS